MILKAITGVTGVTYKYIYIRVISILKIILLASYMSSMSVLLYRCAGDVAAVTVNITHYLIWSYRVTPGSNFRRRCVTRP